MSHPSSAAAGTVKTVESPATSTREASSSTPLDLLWRRLARPYNLVHVIPAMTGLPGSLVADLITLHLGLCLEAGELVDSTNELLRHLTTTSTTTLERCVGTVRGPVQWAETLTARANGLGADDVLVCGSPTRSFDTPENQVLVGALTLVARSALVLDTPAAIRLAPAQNAIIADRAAQARSLLRHHLLRDVRKNRPTERTVTRARNGRHSMSYGAAVDMISRRHEPVRSEELTAWCDARTTGQHRALALVMIAVQKRGLAVPQLRVSGTEVVAGVIRYRNHHIPTPSGNYGILLNEVLVDGPDGTSADERAEALDRLERRAGKRLVCLVSDESDAEMATEMALAGTQWSGTQSARV